MDYHGLLWIIIDYDKSSLIIIGRHRLSLTFIDSHELSCYGRMLWAHAMLYGVVFIYRFDFPCFSFDWAHAIYIFDNSDAKYSLRTIFWLGDPLRPLGRT